MIEVTLIRHICHA